MNPVIAWLDQWRRKLRNVSNPHNLLAVHHAADSKRHGDSFGDHSYGRFTIRRWGKGPRLVVGRFCSISSNVTVFLGGNHRTDWVSTFPFSDFAERWPAAAGHPSTLSSNGDVVIGSDVWIGSGATILSGVAIGHGAVIGAEAVVGKDVEPYAIVAGNPARLVRKRFTDGQVARLLESAWWDLSDEAVSKLAVKLQSDDIEGLLGAVEQVRRAQS